MPCSPGYRWRHWPIFQLASSSSNVGGRPLGPGAARAQLLLAFDGFSVPTGGKNVKAQEVCPEHGSTCSPGRCAVVC